MATKSFKPEYKVSVCFVSPIEISTDKDQVKLAYKDLCGQIATFAEALAADSNSIIAHSVISADPKDMVPVQSNTADAHLLNLQTISKRIGKGKSVVADPKYKSKFESSEATAAPDDDEDPPRVHAGGWTPPEKTEIRPVKAPVTAPAVTIVAKPQVHPELAAKIKDAIFDKIRKTGNSLAIIDFFLANLDKEVHVDDIAKGSKVDKANVQAWLAQTGKSVKAIGRTETRGCYQFDAEKVKIK